MKNKKAFSLIEVILATALLSIVAFGVVSAWLYGEQAVVDSGDHNRAVLIASEGIDIIRNMRDDNFESLIDGTYSLKKTDIGWTLLPGNSEQVGQYARKIIIASEGATKKKISVIVSWSGVGGTPGEVTFDTVLTKWRSPGQVAVATTTPSAGPDVECADGIDNDGDGFIDWPDDPGCIGPTGNNEGYYAACNDSFDNDGDTLVDYPTDPGCTDILDDDETNSGGGGGGPSGPSIIASTDVSGVTKIQRRQIVHDNGFVYGITDQISKSPVVYYFSVDGHTGVAETAQTFVVPEEAGLSASTVLTNLYVTEKYLYITTNDPDHDLLVFSIDNGIITLRQVYNVVTEDGDKAVATDVHVNFTPSSDTDDTAYVTFGDNIAETVVSLSVQANPAFFPPTRLDGYLVAGGAVELCGNDTNYVFVAAMNIKPIATINISTPASLSIFGQSSAGDVEGTEPLSISCPSQLHQGFLGIGNAFVDFNISEPVDPAGLGNVVFRDGVVKDIALDAASSGYAFVATTDKNQFKIVNTNNSAELVVSSTLDMGEDLTGIAYDPHFNYVYAVGPTNFYVINPGL